MRFFKRRQFFSCLTAVAAGWFSSLTHLAAAQAITEFSIPRSSSEPLQIAGSPTGMWFTEHAANRIGLITPDGNISEFPVSRPPISVVWGPDGNLWFTSTGFVSKMTPNGLVTDFLVNEASFEGYPSSIAVGPDGRLWFTDADTELGSIGQVTVTGQVTKYYIPASDPTTITPGPDGNLWFTVFGDQGGSLGDGKIGRVTPSGVVNLFLVPGSRGVSGITGGPDGNLWFTETNSNKIGRITPSGVITEFTVSGNPRGIAGGYDGNLWFTEFTGDRIGRMKTGGEYASLPISTVNAQPWGIAAGSDGNIWFTERGAGQIAKVRTDDVNPYALRLDGNRFDVQLGWISPADEGTVDGGGIGRPVLLTPDAGYFWFTDPANVEVIVKILDWCPEGGIKFFAAGLTNFRVEIDVTDSQTGLTRHYTNPQGAAFRPIQDTFSSCAPGAPGNIAGTWTGTIKYRSPNCDASAQASFQQTGSAVVGTLTGSSPCLGSFYFIGTLQGNALAGTVKDDDFGFVFDAHGVLSGSILEITIDNGSGQDMAQVHLHR